ncbi:MAG: type II 3-dehydroquinate dehydratase [Syntrophomonadaceae bacterium]
MAARILVINGPNLNLLGSREKDIYGSRTWSELETELKEAAGNMGLEVSFFQSNHEGELIDRIHQAHKENYQMLILNAGALTHYSIALHDALKAISLPAIEVHMSNIYQREEFRHKSYLSPAVVGGIFGFGAMSYHLALAAAAQLLKEE